MSVMMAHRHKVYAACFIPVDNSPRSLTHHRIFVDNPSSLSPVMT
ncbi:hypothetical protein [Corynebacterium cystitidis]|nr:hypothetical protein [Corynebacterium cystitidis]